MPNDLTQFDQVAATLQPGDVIFFWGKGLLSGAIDAGEKLLDEGLPSCEEPSHVGILTPGDSGLILFECTEYGNPKVSGPQFNDLGERVAAYDGSVVAVRFSEKPCGYLDWSKVWSAAASMANARGSYNRGRLVEMLLTKFPVIGDIPALYHSDSHAWVCSETVATVLRAGGWPGLVPQCTSPGRLWTSAWWDGEIRTLLGNSPKLDGYNTQ